MRKLTLILLALLALAASAAAQEVVPSVTVQDQFVESDTVTIAEVVSAAEGFLVIHIDNEGRPGPVIGYAPVVAGSNADVVVTIDTAMATPTLFAMLHEDSGVVGEYEFGTVEGADAPVRVDGRVVTPAFRTFSNIRAASQIVLPGDNAPAAEGVSAAAMLAPTVLIDSVLFNSEGFVVIHIDDNGRPGPVAGWGWFTAGLTEGIYVNLDLGVEPTPVLWPMLHEDTGVVGEYEFGTVEGADAPVRVNDAVVTFPINVAPSLVVAAQPLGEEGTVTIAEALIDVDGWLVIHADDGGRPGPVIGATALAAGLNRNVVVTIDDLDMVGTQVFPMLHYDTGVIGEYEFGTVEGADLPVRFAEAVVVLPMAIEG